MQLNNKHVLVTGAGGFIGSHLTEMLIKEGCNVRAFTHYNAMNSWGWIDTFPEEIKNEIEVFRGDITDPYCVREAMQGIDVVFHLAALIGIPYSYSSP
ncbi:SDR family NAD(P)-dependent oxidoreductase, partial [Bacteroidota bacterium]